MNRFEEVCLLKSIHHKVVCLLLINVHKMTRQAALNGCTGLESVCMHIALLKSKQTTLYWNDFSTRIAILYNVHNMTLYARVVFR